MRKGSESKEKRRKSYITIGIVILFISLIAFLCVKYDIKHSKVVEKIIASEYYSNLREEDEMQYEYSKINKELDNLRAFAISDGYVVGVKESGDIVKIIQIESNSSYDYIYNAQKLYLLEKETGKVSIIPLKTENGANYEVTEIIELGKVIDEIQVYEKELYYLSNGTIYKYCSNTDDEIIYNDVTNEEFILKLGYLYVIKQNNLVKVNIETNEELLISRNVLNFNYYDFYEKNKIIFETSIDSQNIFKNILNVYSNEINNSVKNNGYFVVYGSNEYIYVNNDKKSLYLIDKNGSSKLLYNAKNVIDKVIFIKEGYVVVYDGDDLVTIDLTTKKADRKFEINIDNIKYIK